jgi:hypothetical protein
VSPTAPSFVRRRSPVFVLTSPVGFLVSVIGRGVLSTAAIADTATMSESPMTTLTKAMRFLFLIPSALHRTRNEM